MKNDDYQNEFDTALNVLREEASNVDTEGFEHKVWTEISLKTGWNWRGVFGWLWEGRTWELAVPTSAVVTVSAVAVGASLAFSQSAVYGKQASQVLERQYVESIHPVLMSSNHNAPSLTR